MRATVDKVLSQIKEFFSGLTPKERRRLIVLGALIVALSITAAWLLGRTNWVTLEAGLAPAVAGQYKAAIEAMGYTCRLADGGTTVEVPEENRSDIWAGLSLQGVGVAGGNQSMEVYQSIMDNLGATDQDKKAALAWQYAQWVQQDLMSYDYIEDATVRFSIGEKSTGLIRPANPTTASVMVGVQGNAQLSESQVQAIVSHVSGAMDGLTADNISLSDRTGILYDTTSGTAAGGASISQRLALESQTRSAIERQVHNLFVPVVGVGNIQVSANVVLDMDETSIRSVEFAPPVEGMEEGLKVSLYELWESSSAGEAAGGIPGTDTNGIGTVEYPYLDLGADEYYRQYVREINYELNETVTEIEKAKGSVQDLTVSVLVNSSAVEEDYTETMRSLAATALGIRNSDAVITVAYLPFAPAPEMPPETGLPENVRDLITLGIKALVVLLLGLAIIGFLRGVFRVGQKEQLALAEGAGIDYMAEGDVLEDEEGESVEPIELMAKSETLTQLESFIDKDPAAVVLLLRNWLSDE